MTTADYKMRYKQWVAGNPLRQWRKEEGLTTVEVSTTVGVSHKSVQYWETNITQPKGENLTKLAEIMDVDAATLHVRWQEWLEDRPTLI